MQTSKEIRSNLNNIKYYANELQRLIKLQFDTDCEAGNRLGVNTGAGNKRFLSLGIIHTASEWIKVYCDNIEANIKNAEMQDKELHTFDEEQALEQELPF